MFANDFHILNTVRMTLEDVVLQISSSRGAEAIA